MICVDMVKLSGVVAFLVWVILLAPCPSFATNIDHRETNRDDDPFSTLESVSDTDGDASHLLSSLQQGDGDHAKKNPKNLLSLFWKGRRTETKNNVETDDDNSLDEISGKSANDKEEIRKILKKFYGLADPKFARASMAKSRTILPPPLIQEGSDHESRDENEKLGVDDENELLPGTILQMIRPIKDEKEKASKDKEDEVGRDNNSEEIQLQEEAYELLDKVHQELGENPKHYTDFAYTSVMESSVAKRRDATTPSLALVPLGPKHNSLMNKKDRKSCQAVSQKLFTKFPPLFRERQQTDVFRNSREDKTTLHSAWWKWWIPFSNNEWWKSGGSTKEDYHMDDTAFAGGSNGEVWRGRRICQRGHQDRRTNASNRNQNQDFRSFWNPSNRDHNDKDNDESSNSKTEPNTECDDQTPLILKRLKIERGFLLLEAGLREIYFGKLISRVLEQDKRDMYTVYVDHFFREVPRNADLKKPVFGGMQKISPSQHQQRYSRENDLELWIVYEDAGPSLRSYVYSPVSSSAEGGFVMHQHSKLWTKLRTFSGEKEDQDTFDTSLEVRNTMNQRQNLRDDFGERRRNKKKNQNKRIGQLFTQKILRGILEAASELHKRGIIHRDIKPSNVMCRSDVPIADSLFDSPTTLPNFHCRLGDFSSGWDHYTSQNLYTKGPTPGEQTNEYAPPESFVGPFWKPFDDEKPETFDSWSIGVLSLELILGTPNVFSVDQRTNALLTTQMKRAGATDDEIAYALYLAALSQFCIFVPSNDVSKEDSWPLRHGDPLHKTAMVKESCTLQDFHRALRARDPLGIGFDSSTDLLLHLIWQLLAYDPDERVTAEEALLHPYFISPDGTLDSLQKIPGFHNALESQMLDPRIDFDVEDEIKEYQCPKCGRIFHDWRSCHQHANLRKHAKFCTYNHTVLPSCINTHSMLPEHPTSGYCDLQGRRSTIEDFHSIHLHHDHQFYGIFDGHTGNLASKFAASELYTELLHHLPRLKDTVPSNMNNSHLVQWKDEVRVNVTKAFERVHSRFLDSIKTLTSPIIEVGSAPKMDQSGTTATALIVTEHLLVAAVLGDSRGVLSSSKTKTEGTRWNNFPHVSAIPFSIDHVASNRIESDLVLQRGGSISTDGLPRVNGTLAITRSIGDAKLAPLLSREPNVVVFDRAEVQDVCGKLGKPRTGGEESGMGEIGKIPCFVILASDGLWDVMSNQEAVDMVVDIILKQKNKVGTNQSDQIALFTKESSLSSENGSGPFQEAAERLAVEAYVRGSMDNIGVCVVAID